MALRLARALTNSSLVHDATVTRDLVLMIVMPILAVTIPVTILVLWLLRHFMRSHSHYRGQDHYGNRKPDDVDVEDNVITEQTPNNGDESDGESQTERKKAIDDEEYDDENNNEDPNRHADGEEREEQDEERDGEEEDEESEDDSSSSDEDNKVNEEQPLMEDSISPDA